jgi:hypothetical protein
LSHKSCTIITKGLPPSLRLAGCSLFSRNEKVRGVATGFRPRTSDADRLLLAADDDVTDAGDDVTVADEDDDVTDADKDDVTAAEDNDVKAPAVDLLSVSVWVWCGGCCSCSLGVGEGDDEHDESECGDGDRSSRLFGFIGIFGLSLSSSGGLRVMTGLGVPLRMELEMCGPTT